MDVDMRILREIFQVVLILIIVVATGALLFLATSYTIAELYKLLQ